MKCVCGEVNTNHNMCKTCWEKNKIKEVNESIIYGFDDRVLFNNLKFNENLELFYKDKFKGYIYIIKNSSYLIVKRTLYYLLGNLCL